MKRIALLNFGGIGDEILFSPVIQAIHQAYPQAELTLFLEHRSRSIVDLLPEVHHVETLSLDGQSRLGIFGKLLMLLRKHPYDAVISSGSSPFIAVLLWASGIPLRVGFDSGKPTRMLLSRPAPLHRNVYAGQMYFTLAQTFLALMGKPIPDITQGIPSLSVAEATREHAQKLLAAAEIRPPQTRMMIHPGVSRMSVEKNILKAWPVERWLTLMTALATQHPEAGIYLLGGPDDAEVIGALSAACKSLPQEVQARIVNFYGKTRSFGDLAGLLTMADVLISVDSAPMHLAIGIKCPVVALFSPTDPHKLVPQTDTVQVAFRDDLSCRPCLWDLRQTSCDTPLCLDISVETVMERVNRLLTTSPTPH